MTRDTSTPTSCGRDAGIRSTAVTALLGLFCAMCILAALFMLIIAASFADGFGEGESAFSTIGNVGSLALVFLACGAALWALVRLLNRGPHGLSLALLAASAIGTVLWWLVVLG